MKMIFLFLFYSVFLVLLVFTVCGSVSTSGQVAYFRFDQNHSDTWNGFNSTLGAGALNRLAGETYVLGNASYHVDFDGEGTLINYNISELTEFTFSSWVKPGANFGADTFQAVFYQPKDPSGDTFWLAIHDGVSKCALRNSGGSMVTVDIDSSPDLGVWQMWSCRYNGTHLSSVLNGSIVSSVSITSIYLSFNELSIGNDNDFTGSYFEGLIDEVSISNRSWTDAELLSSWNNGSGLDHTLGDTSAPAITLISPVDEDHNSVSSVNFTFNVSDDSELLNCSLFTNSTGGWDLNATNSSPITKTGSNGIVFDVLSDGVYSWNVKCFDASNNTGFASSNFTYVYDITNISISWIDPVNDKFTSNNFSIKANVSDNNLYRVNVTLFNSSDGYVWNTFYDLINVTVFELNEPSNISQADQNFSIEICGSDDHTDGVMPKKGKKGESHLFFNSTDDVQLSEVKISFVEKDNKATDTPGDLITTYKTGDEWDINFSVIKPETKIVFNVSSSHKIIDRSYKGIDGHLVWGEFFHDFSVAKTFLVNGEPRTASLQTTRLDDFNYQIIWTPDIALLGGDTIFIDPLSGGLNFKCENKTIVFDTSYPNINLLSPNDLSIIKSDSTNLAFNVTSSVSIDNCSLFINGQFNKSDVSITKNVEQTFSFTGLNYQGYNWLVSCYDNTFKISNSSEWTFTINTDTGGGNGGGGGGGGSPLKIKGFEEKPDISFSIDTLTFTVLSLPYELEKTVLIKNVGNDEFDGALYVDGDVAKYLSTSVCQINGFNCISKNIKINSGESRILKINGNFDQFLGAGGEALIKLSHDDDEYIFELPVSVDRYPLYKVVSKVQNVFSLDEKKAFIFVYFGAGLLLVLLFFVWGGLL